ncbi:ATP-binding cassette domain-containing protein [Rarobacter incanus]|uniref:ABC transporter family protein n=1 Tax=Rarobacter incanus TaxID=153494 RepID=A0A542SN50_9MICO|nr:ATP-binding cassette domain-containing protein [Rarobacter incanus]TQK75925.1 ABC transporter family protein [Rarobacter incanus]
MPDKDSSPSDARLAVHATAVTLSGPRGPVYGPLDLEIPEGELSVIIGPQGSGRSSLLLTIAGRMKPNKGSELTVLGHRLPAQRKEVQRVAAIAGFDGIDTVDGGVTVGAALRERIDWLSPWYRPAPRLNYRTYAHYAAAVFGDRKPPKLETYIWDLDELDQMLLRIVIALVQRPRLLVVDDLDQVHDFERRCYIWNRLQAMAAQGLTIVAAVASAGEIDRVDWRGSRPLSIVIPRRGKAGSDEFVGSATGSEGE